MLSLIVSKHPDPKWSEVSEEFNKAISLKEPGIKRTNKQCRER